MNGSAIETSDRVFIHALAPIAPGNEFLIDYGLSVDGAVIHEVA
ncbi:hypothetical protein [Paraburkholderia youngii]